MCIQSIHWTLPRRDDSFIPTPLSMSIKCCRRASQDRSARADCRVYKHESCRISLVMRMPYSCAMALVGYAHTMCLHGRMHCGSSRSLAKATQPLGSPPFRPSSSSSRSLLPRAPHLGAQVNDTRRSVAAGAGGCPAGRVVCHVRWPRMWCARYVVGGMGFMAGPVTLK